MACVHYRPRTGFVGSALDEGVAGQRPSGARPGALRRPGRSPEGGGPPAVHMGSLEDVESLKAGAAQADRQCASRLQSRLLALTRQNCEDDRRAIEALGSVLAGKAAARDLRHRHGCHAGRARDRGHTGAELVGDAACRLRKKRRWQPQGKA